jgi:hypothetical protein
MIRWRWLTLKGLGLKDDENWCRGDDHLGRPRGEQRAGWRPRDHRDTRPMRPASIEGPAMPAVGQELLHWRPKPVMTTRSLINTLLKLAGARQERQRLETAMMPAMDGHHQPRQVNPLSMKGSEERRGLIPQICRSRGQEHFIKWLALRQRSREKWDPC